MEQAVLGAPGAQYTLREWDGLWPQGQFRYTLGQRALVFLHGNSPAGFGSPVDGAEGVVPVIVRGANAPELLDVRRLSAALLRPVGAPLAQPTGTLRQEPVRLPMPVHDGFQGGLQGTTGVQPGSQTSAAAPRESQPEVLYVAH